MSLFFFTCTTTKALLVNLEQPDHVKPRFVSKGHLSSRKLKGQKTLADIAHFESCARRPLQKCHGSGAAFFSLSKMMAVKPSHVGEVKLDEVLLEKGCTSFLLIHVFLYTCSGSFSTSSPECLVQSSLLACESRVKRKTWV